MLRNLFFVLLAIVATSSSSSAQGTLQFNQALKIANSPSTVPAGKVWKVTSIYGGEFRYNTCVDLSSTSTHELNRMRCAYASTTLSKPGTSYNISKMIVDGVSIISSVDGLPDVNQSYSFRSTADCSGSGFTNTVNLSCANKDSDPNLLPIWLAAGAVVESGGPNTFVSVLEFNIVP